MYFASSVNIHDISLGKALSQDVFKNSHLTIFTYATETEEICSSSRRIKKAKLKCTTCFLSFFFFSTKKHYFFSEVPLLETKGTTKTKKKKKMISIWRKHFFPIAYHQILLNFLAQRNSKQFEVIRNLLAGTLPFL